MLFRGFILAGAIALASGGCGGCSSEGFPDAFMPDAAMLGTVQAAWSVTDRNGQPITCDQVGANTVALQLRSRSSLSGVAASFSCGNSPSTSQPILSGVYDVSFELHGGGLTLATVPDQNGIVVNPGQRTMLAPVVFPVDANGGLVLSFAAPPSTKNCENPPAGEGITGMAFSLVDAGGSCATVTFQRSRGGTYKVSCSPALQAGCIEANETYTVASMPSGSYTIHIRGTLSGLECWKNDDVLQVPPQGRLLTQTMNLERQVRVMGCER